MSSLGVGLAVERLVEAIERRERVLVFGDYDADGITAAAILWWGLRALGLALEVVLPHRAEGYGLPLGRAAEFASRCELLVTVDCGISSVAEVAALRRTGVDVLVTDHHTIAGPIPDALVVHPPLGAHAMAAASTGAAIAHHLLWGLHRRLGMPEPTSLTPLAAIGVIADVARMDVANRALVRAGLAAMETSPLRLPGGGRVWRHRVVAGGGAARWSVL